MKQQSSARARLFLRGAILLGLCGTLIGLPAIGQPGKDLKDGAAVVQTFKGHKDAVFTLAFTPDGKYVLTGSFDHTLKMWDAASGQEVRTFGGPTGHTKMVVCAAVSKDGQYLASGSTDNTLKVWDVPSSSPLREFAAKEAVNAVALSADGKKLATGLKDGLVKIWNAEDGKELLTLKGHAGAVKSVAFSANGLTLASCDTQGMVRFWTVADGKAAGEIGAHSGSVNGVVFNPNNVTAYSVGQDGTVRFWAVATPLPRAFPPHAQTILTTALSADSAQVLSASADKVARVTNFANGTQLRVLADVPAPITAATFNGNATQIAGGTQEGQFIVWNNTDGKIVAQALAHEGAVTGVSIKAQNDQAITGGADGLLRVWALPLPASKSLAHPDEVLAAAWKADGTKVYTGGKDKIVRSWLVANAQIEKPFAGHTAPVTAVALSPDGKILASGGEDTTIRLWNPVDGKETALIGGHGARVTSLQFNAAGTQLLSASADGTVKLWQVPPPAPKSLAHPDQVTGLTLTPDGTKLITGGADKIVRTWNLATAAKEKDLPGLTQAVSSVAVSGKGQFVAGGSADKNLIVWNLADGKEVKKIATPAPITAVALDTDGKVAVAGRNDSAIQLFNITDGKEIKKLTGHKGAISGLVYTTKGDEIISSSADKMVKIWNVADGMAKTTLEHVGPVSCVALSKDGTHVAAGSAKSIKVWKLADGKEVTNITTKGDVRSLSFSPKGEIVAVGEADNSTRVYGLDGKLSFFLAHAAPVNAVAFSNDGKQIITGGADKQAAVWTPPLVWQQTVGGPVRQIVLNAKANQVIVAGENKSIKLLNAVDGKEVKAFPAHDAAVTGIGITADSGKLISAGADKTIKVWNLTMLDKDKEIKPLATIPVKGEPQSVSVSPDGNRLAVAVAEDKANLVRVYDVGSGKELQTLRDHKGAISVLAFHTDNKTILSAGADKTARLDTVGVVALLNAHPGGVSAVHYHTNGTQAISAGADKTVKLWDLVKGTVLKTFGPVEEAIQQASFSKDSTQVAAASGKSVRIWNAADGKELAKLDHPAKVTSVSFNADKSKVATGCEDKQTRIWDVAGKRVLEYFHQEEPNSTAIFHTAGTSVVFSSGKMVTVGSLGNQRVIAASDQPLQALAVIPAGTHVLAGGADKAVKLWNVANGTAEKTFAATGAVQAVAVAPNATMVAVGSADKMLRVFNYADAKEIKAEQVPGEIQSLRFSPNSQILVGACAKNTIMAWDMLFTAGQPVPDSFLKIVQVFNHGDLPTEAVIGPDNATVYSGSADKTARAWRLASPSPKISLPHPGSVMAVAISPNNKLFASGSIDGKIRVYDMDKKTLVKEITAHTTKDQTGIYGVAFSPDGQNVASAGMDKDIKIFNATSGALVKEIKGYKVMKGTPVKDTENGHKDTVNCLAFSPDGKILATGSAGLERVIKLWNIPEGTLLRSLDNPQVKKGKFDKDARSHPGWIYSLSFTKDSKHLVSSGNAPKNKGYLAVWKVADGSLVSGQELPLGVFYGLAISPDESVVAVGAGALGPATPQFNCAYLLKLPPMK
jgi:WD40 repeat protein